MNGYRNAAAYELRDWSSVNDQLVDFFDENGSYVGTFAHSNVISWIDWIDQGRLVRLRVTDDVMGVTE